MMSPIEARAFTNSTVMGVMLADWPRATRFNSSSKFATRSLSRSAHSRTRIFPRKNQSKPQAEALHYLRQENKRPRQKCSMLEEPMTFLVKVLR